MASGGETDSESLVELEFARFVVRPLKPADSGSDYVAGFSDSALQQVDAYQVGVDAIENAHGFVVKHDARGHVIGFGGIASNGRDLAKFNAGAD